MVRVCLSSHLLPLYLPCFSPSDSPCARSTYEPLKICGCACFHAIHNNIVSRVFFCLAHSLLLLSLGYCLLSQNRNMCCLVGVVNGCEAGVSCDASSFFSFVWREISFYCKNCSAQMLPKFFVTVGNWETSSPCKATWTTTQQHHHNKSFNPWCEQNCRVAMAESKQSIDVSSEDEHTSSDEENAPLSAEDAAVVEQLKNEGKSKKKKKKSKKSMKSKKHRGKPGRYTCDAITSHTVVSSLRARAHTRMHVCAPTRTHTRRTHVLNFWQTTLSLSPVVSAPLLPCSFPPSRVI